jgi:hypothetical protein
MAAVGDRAVAAAVAEHKSWFFVEKDAGGAEIDYRAAVGGNLQIVPTGAARDALDEDYGKMTEDGILQSAPTFDELMTACLDIEARANGVARG